MAVGAVAGACVVGPALVAGAALVTGSGAAVVGEVCAWVCLLMYSMRTALACAIRSAGI